MHQGWFRLCLFAGGSTATAGEGRTPAPGHVPFGSSLSAPLACWFLRRLSAVHLGWPCHPPWPPTAVALAVVGRSHEKPGHPGWVRLRCPKSFARPDYSGRTSLVGYQWSHTGLRPGRKISHNRYIRSFVSQPPLNQGDPPCSFPPWLRMAAGSDRFWLLELRVSRTFLYQLQPQLFRELIPKSMYCKYLRHSSDRFWLLELRVSRTFLDFLRPQLLSMCSTGGMLP
jgi:hypothetical protein